MNCKSCGHYKPTPVSVNKVSGWGECHRFPPKAVIIGERVVSIYPTVAENDRCGEHVDLVKHEADSVVQK